MKDKLFISSFQSCTEYGFIAKSIGDKLVEKKDCIVRCLPDFEAVNQFDSRLSPLLSEKSSNISTIIQYVPTEYIEYHFGYKNIVIADIKQFIKRNLSILDKLSLADEIWVFDEQQKEFIGEKLFEKIKVIGYPYSRDRIAELFDNKTRQKKNYTEYYCISDISNIENIECLIYNFILVFNPSFDTHLTIYIKHYELETEKINEIISDMMVSVMNSCKFIEETRLKDLVTITIGNPYVDTEKYVNQHVEGDCYINIDYMISPDAITASYLGKYILSIMDIGNAISFNDDHKIVTHASNYRKGHGASYYYNEYNSFPKIDDISIQKSLVNIHKKIKDKIPAKECYKTFDSKNFLQ